MAEDISTGLPVPEEVGGEKEFALPEVPENSKQAVVRPKERKPWQEGGSAENIEAFETGIAQASSGNWWHSSALTGPMMPRPPTPPPAGAPFQGWRERRWTEDEEGEWSYSTGPGATTMDVLRERFGEANFWDVPSWQQWTMGVDPTTTWQGGWGLREQILVST